MIELRESNLDHHTITHHNTFKVGFHGRSKYGLKGLKLAIQNRCEDIKANKAEFLKELKHQASIYTNRLSRAISTSPLSLLKIKQTISTTNRQRK